MDYQRITDVPAVSDVAGSDSVYIRQGDTFRRISVADFLQALGITDGVSPTVTVAIISGGHRITITDADGTKTIDVMDGATGADGSDGNDGADGGYYTPGRRICICRRFLFGKHRSCPVFVRRGKYLWDHPCRANTAICTRQPCGGDAHFRATWQLCILDKPQLRRCICYSRCH